jgi:hypothetical protein
VSKTPIWGLFKQKANKKQKNKKTYISNIPSFPVDHVEHGPHLKYVMIYFAWNIGFIQMDGPYSSNATFERIKCFDVTKDSSSNT